MAVAGVALSAAAGSDTELETAAPTAAPLASYNVNRSVAFAALLPVLTTSALARTSAEVALEPSAGVPLCTIAL